MATNKRSAFSFPGIPSYPTVTPRSEPAKNIGDCSDEEFEDEDDSLTPAWHCTECGKLNMVDVFRSGWSWSCSNCGVLASSGYKNRLSVHLCDRNLPPPLPIPDPHGYLKHTVSAGPKGEEYITYKFQCTGIVLQHIPSSEHDHLLAQANTVLENLQAHVDFRLTDLGPKVSYLSYHIESRKAFVAAPRAAQEVWCFLEGLVTCRFGLAVDVLSYARELTELQCIAWRCKGSTKASEPPINQFRLTLYP
ncbi:hypothetical protein JB92DRAFT_130485 [Gautieria morchelliformis]|nr:hypothetical protein JB92DRAFT_130485 [Gautieria morchelliformis]